MDSTWIWFTAVPTYGSMSIGVGLMLHYLIGWWPGLKSLSTLEAWASLAPFALAYCFGVLLILGVGGIVGLASNLTLWGVGWLGDGALVFGMGGSRQFVGRGTQHMALSNGALMVVLILAFVFVALAARNADLAYPIKRGWLCGVLTGTVSTVSAALAVPLASAVNALASLFPASG